MFATSKSSLVLAVKLLQNRIWDAIFRNRADLPYRRLHPPCFDTRGADFPGTHTDHGLLFIQRRRQVSTEFIQGIAPTLIIVRAGMNLRGEEMPISDTQRPILGARMVQPDLNKGKDEETVINGTTPQLPPILSARILIFQPDLNKDMPAIPPDVEKGQPDYGSGKTWSF